MQWLRICLTGTQPIRKLGLAQVAGMVQGAELIGLRGFSPAVNICFDIL